MNFLDADLTDSPEGRGLRGRRPASCRPSGRPGRRGRGRPPAPLGVRPEDVRRGPGGRTPRSRCVGAHRPRDHPDRGGRRPDPGGPGPGRAPLARRRDREGISTDQPAPPLRPGLRPASRLERQRLPDPDVTGRRSRAGRSPGSRSGPGACVLAVEQRLQLPLQVGRPAVLLRRLERVHRRPVVLPELATNSDGGPGKSNVYVSRANEIRSAGTPAAANRSMTWLSTPHVIGLTNPSGGGGE